MSKTRTKRVAVAAPQSLEDARDWLRQFGERSREAEAIKLGMNDQISRIKEEAENKASPVKDELTRLETGIHAWAEANRVELTRKSKTVDLGVGTVRWRQRPPSVRITGKAADLLARLKAMGFARFIRVKEEINKDALLGEPAIAAEIKGVSISSAGEDFVIEPVNQAISEGRST